MSDKALTHFDERGNARMVDVGTKVETERVAVAHASVTMQPATLALIRDGPRHAIQRAAPFTFETSPFAVIAIV